MTFSNLLRAGAAALAITAVAGTAHAQTVDVPLIESGSSLLYPLFNIWVGAYSAVNTAADITTTSTGSGVGIAQAIAGLIQIGGSDAYLSDLQAKTNPTVESIPLAISSQGVFFNVPGISHLNLSGPVLAGIYEGKITQWNDPAIAAANPGVNLPAHQIVPVHREDSSGDTFIFTSYLAKSDAQWATTEKFGTSVKWPASTVAIGAKGNAGMLTAAAGAPYSVAYIGISFADKATAAGLSTAALQNHDGNYVLPTQDNVKAAAASVANSTPADERISIIDTAGANNYPIVNYEYAIVDTNQPAPAIAGAIRDFLTWAVTDGNAPAYLNQVHFLPLPAPVKVLTEAQIANIQ